MYFTFHDRFFGEDIELIPGGNEQRVSESNKKQFVRLLLEKRFQKDISTQVNAFRSGFESILKLEHIQHFTSHELQQLICGSETISVKDWRKNTAYEGCSEHHNVCVWFFEVLESWDDKQRSRMLQFITGSSRVPLVGFPGLATGATASPITIILSSFPGYRLPVGRTCFNSIELPSVSSKDELEKSLQFVVDEGILEGFHVV